MWAPVGIGGLGPVLRLLSHLCFDELQTRPKERDVIICESSEDNVGEETVRHALGRVLFDQLGVASLCLVPCGYLALRACNSRSGLVLDVGFRECRAVPVFEGVIIRPAVRVMQRGASSILGQLRSGTQLVSTAQGQAQQQCSGWMQRTEVVEDLLMRACFVRNALDVEGEGEEALDVRFRIPVSEAAGNSSGDSDAILLLPGSVRGRVAEPLFHNNLDIESLVKDSAVQDDGYDENNDGGSASIQHVLLDALLACPIDVRPHVAHHVVLAGGAAMLPGFCARVAAAAKRVVQHSVESNVCCYASKYASLQPLISSSFETRAVPFPRSTLAWVGGSLLAATVDPSCVAVSSAEYFRSGLRSLGYACENAQKDSEPTELGVDDNYSVCSVPLAGTAAAYQTLEQQKSPQLVWGLVERHPAWH